MEINRPASRVERMFRAGGHPGRQSFRDVDGLIALLAPSLQPDEPAAREHLGA